MTIKIRKGERHFERASPNKLLNMDVLSASFAGLLFVGHRRR